MPNVWLAPLGRDDWNDLYEKSKEDVEKFSKDRSQLCYIYDGIPGSHSNPIPLFVLTAAIGWAMDIWNKEHNTDLSLNIIFGGCLAWPKSRGQIPALLENINQFKSIIKEGERVIMSYDCRGSVGEPCAVCGFKILPRPPPPNYK